MSQQGYTFPPIYDFPPLFTIQQNETTRVKQLTMWAEIIRGYCKKYNVYEFNIDKIDSNIDPRSHTLIERSAEQVFANPRIKRSLTRASALTVIEHLIASNGAFYTSTSSSQKDKRASGIILWKNIDTWSDEIYKWSQETGRKNTICTLHELIYGDATSGLPFHGINEELALRIFSNLSAKNLVVLLHGNSRLEIGIKFA